MKFTIPTTLALLSASSVIAHPERMTPEVARQEANTLSAGRAVGRSDKCAGAIEKRKADMMEKRAQSLYRRRVESGNMPAERSSMTSPVKRNLLHYQDIQNTTAALAPDTIWGP